MIIDFLKYIRVVFFFSFFLFVLSFFSIFINRFNFGLEFVGGLEIEIKSNDINDLANVRSLLKDIKEIKIRYYGSNDCIQLKLKSNLENVKSILDDIEYRLSKMFKITKINYVSPEINTEIIKNSFIAISIAIILMLSYVSFRFKYYLAFSAILALFYNVILVLGFISFLKLEFDLILLSAIFAVFGYSINDTIVIFDRLRENLFLYDEKKAPSYIINVSINSTLSRTLMTSISTLFVVFILLFFAGDYLFGFSLVLSFGIIVGTYSSIYIATLPLYFLNKLK
jgi:preprotein translocase subunit SecF